MIISYDKFCKLLVDHIQSGKNFYLSLLETIIDNPSRYCGLFRLSNAKSKLIQNVTQSREIKFGDVIEELTTEYLSKLGYKNYDKNLGEDEYGDNLNVDQYFSDGNYIYMVEMKIRDDHDSTKKRGQYSNFHKKLVLLRKRHPDKHINAIMWFVDDGLVKNKNYYKEEMSKENIPNSSLHLYYGGEFFESLNNGHEAWNELIEILSMYRREHSNVDDVTIPDFGSSKEIFNALLELDDRHWKKLLSDKKEYEQLRNELFSDGDNLEKVKKIRI